ncbi:amidohydrolase [Gryllotalpicola reticulitermitis]|uniref:Amidohydrolase n=1 Tax=Gryllotalpicola reticulitermitis TaxID=1184153 RepID=A0ABV8Q680_9MICO
MSFTFSGARLLDGRVVDVTVTDTRITAVTPAGELRASGEHIELDGHVLVPGLWDQHTHFTQWALSSRRVRLDSAASADEAARLLGEHAARHPDGDVIGVGFRDALWADRPHFALLDDAVDGTIGEAGSGASAAGPERRVVALSADLHTVWLNSAALKAHGFHDHPSGVLREADAFAVEAALDEVSDATADEWAHDAALAAAARGVVGIVDFEMALTPELWLRRFASGFDELQVDAGFYPEHLDAAIAAGWSTGQTLDDSGRLRVGPLKVITDGSLGTRTAAMFAPYDGVVGDEPRGRLTVPPSDLVALLRTARRMGLSAAVHAIGDAANSHALDAFAATGARGSIEHAQLLRREDFPRFAALGVTASVQPRHAIDDQDIVARYWGDRAGRAYAFRSLLDAGARLAFGSDAPVAPLDPWQAISAAVFRQADDAPPWHAEQAISLGQAVRASVRSSILPGQPADLAVLASDPRDADAGALRAQPVAATVLAGRFTYDAIR